MTPAEARGRAFHGRAHAHALRLGLHPMEKPHVWQGEGGIWYSTRAQKGDLDRLARGFVDNLNGDHSTAEAEEWWKTWDARLFATTTHLSRCPV